MARWRLARASVLPQARGPSSEETVISRNTPSPIASFDVIVVGAGAAGCVLANRLSADPAVRVALVEAGPSDTGFLVNVKTTLPIGNIFLLPHERYNWQHQFSSWRRR